MRAAPGFLWPLEYPALFPAYAVQQSVGFDPVWPLHPQRDFPGIALPEWFEGAVQKRQMEFLAGRHCAREALRTIAPELAETSISTGRNREPLWPPGIVGAITHSGCYASAVVARSGDVRGLGLDFEVLMGLEAELQEQVAGPDELESLARSTNWPLPLLLTLVFSAKESLFKCLYPQIGCYFEFHDAVVNAIDPEEGQFTIQLRTRLSAEFSAGYELRGRFAQHEAMLLTAVVLPV